MKWPQNYDSLSFEDKLICILESRNLDLKNLKEFERLYRDYDKDLQELKKEIQEDKNISQNHNEDFKMSKYIFICTKTKLLEFFDNYNKTYGKPECRWKFLAPSHVEDGYDFAQLDKDTIVTFQVRTQDEHFFNKMLRSGLGYE